MAAPADDDDGPTEAYCVVWVYRDSPEAFEKAARFALQNAGYGLPVVVVLTESGARLMQVDRMAALFRKPGLAEVIDQLAERNVFFELDIGSARRAGIVETLGSAIPTLRIADDVRLAELTSSARVTARY